MEAWNQFPAEVVGLSSVSEFKHASIIQQKIKNKLKTKHKQGKKLKVQTQ